MPALLLIALVLILPAPAAAQRDTFVDSLVAFHSALPGTYGDEGSGAAASLERMTAALEAWEKAGAAAEAALRRRAPIDPADLALHAIDQGQLDAAIQAMTAAVAAEPGRAPLHLYLGFLHDSAGHPAEAAAAFTTAWELEPGDPLHAYLAMARRAEDADDDAVERALAALMNARGLPRPAPFLQFSLVDDKSADTPVFAPVAYADGFASIAAGRHRAAIEQFRAAAARDPLFTDAAGRNARVLQGIAALRDRNGEAALDHLRAAAALLPESAELHRVLGIAYRAMGRLEESVKHFQTAVERAPGDERARVALGTALAESGDLSGAERVLRETVERLPASGDARWALANVYDALGRGLDAIAALEEATSLTILAGKAPLWWRIADLAHRHQDYDRVVVMLSARARLRANEPLVHRDLGLAYTRVGRDNRALVELLMTSLLGHEDAEMLGAMGQIHLNAGRLEAAESRLRRAVALDPALPQPRYALGSTLLRLGRAADAKEQLAEFQRLRTAALEEQRRAFEIETLTHEGDLHVGAGRFQDAIAPYEKAAALGGPADIYRRLAGVYEKLGRSVDRQKALAAYEQRRQQEAR